MRPLDDPTARTEESPHRCPDCKGTGRTRVDVPEHIVRGTDRWGVFYKRVAASYFMKRCWSCLGNGLDPAAFFRNVVVLPPRHAVLRPNHVIRVSQE